MRTSYVCVPPKSTHPVSSPDFNAIFICYTIYILFTYFSFSCGVYLKYKERKKKLTCVSYFKYAYNSMRIIVYNIIYIQYVCI